MFKALIAAVSLFCLPLGSTTQAQDANNIPDLIGKWGSTSQIHHMALGHTKIEANNTEVVVLSRAGRVFHGSISWINKPPGKGTFSGVIDKDSATFYLVGPPEGMRIGTRECPEAFTGYIMITRGANSIAQGSSSPSGSHHIAFWA